METTLYIRQSIMRKIDNAAEVRRISSSAIIMLLLREYMQCGEAQARVGRLVQYQERGGDEERHVFHLYLKGDEYEYVTDCRKFFKLSASLMVALAVMKYLNGNEKLNDTDNYPLCNYIIIKEEIDHLICWRSIWGYTDLVENYIT